MSYRSYIPKRGDLIHMNFSPSAGREMAERHYALVVSTHDYNKVARLAIVCPITSTARNWPWEIAVPTGLLPDKKGVGAVSSVIYADFVRSIDFREREAEFVAEAPAAIVEEVLDRMLSVMEQ